MGKKTLTNAHCLLELIESAPLSAVRVFSDLPSCQALRLGFDWERDSESLLAALIEHIKHLRKDQRAAAEQEALRVLRLASPRGAAILVTVADQLHDNEQLQRFLAQDGGEIGRAIWMRCHSDDSARLFEVAESILNTGDLRGNKRLYDAFDIPCETPPPFIWNDGVKKLLETQFTAAMRLTEPCDVIYVPITDERDNGHSTTMHYLVVRFAGDQVAAVQVINRNRKSFYYFPARDATLVYVPERKVVEAYAPSLTSRAPLAEVLSRHGFKVPLSNRPLNRTRYDLSPFARPLREVKPIIEGARIERLYLTEAKALIGHATDAVTVHVDSGCELHQVIGSRWNDHPFIQPGAILGVTLVADLILDGQIAETPLSIVLAEPGRCSLAGERDQRLRQVGTHLLEALGVLRPLHPGSGVDDPDLVGQVARLIESATSPIDGFALAQLGIDIERFEDEGIITEGERITEKVVQLTDGEHFTVTLERCSDVDKVRYRDPLTGIDVVLPAKHARRWKVDMDWLREEIITALGAALQGVRGQPIDEEPVFLGELEIDGQRVVVYFAARMSNKRQYAKVDATLRLQPRSVPGIVLTTAAIPFPFAGSNVVIAVEDVLSSSRAGSAIDMNRLKVAYRHGQQSARGGHSVHLRVSDDGYTAVLYVPGKAPWRVTGKDKITVLQRLVQAFAAGTPHVASKVLMEGTTYSSPANLFASKKSPWRNYLAKVEGMHAWQLHLPMLNDPIDDPTSEAEILAV